MRTTVDIDDHLLRRLRSEAHRQGVPLKALLEAVLRRGLAERPGARSRYRCPTFSMGTPAAGYSLDKALVLSAVLEDDEVVRELTMRK